MLQVYHFYPERTSPVILSCCIWALSGPERDVLSRIAGAGFRSIDTRPDTLTPEGARAGIRDLGLSVSCVAASFGLPEGAALDSPEADAAAEALAHTEKTLAYAADLGATAAYLVPGPDGSPEALSRYAHALTSAADRAGDRGLKLCIEHFPGSALPTAKGTLDFLQEVGHPNLYLLFDIGHAQMSGEDPADTVAGAGDRLGYVHLDDNDGQNDLHLSLTDGILTEDVLRRTFSALSDAGYDGAVSLELHAELLDPLDALKRSREIVRRVAQIA